MKSLLVLGASHEQLHAIALARKLCIRTIAMDREQKPWTDNSPDIFVHRDPSDFMEVLRSASFYRVDGILCAGIELADVCAQACHCLGLPGVKPSAARICSDKLKLAECLKAHDIPHPETIQWKMGVPWVSTAAWVTKPSDNSGARGVNLFHGSPTDPGFDEAWRRAAGNCRSGVPILQRYIAGRQISIEGYVAGDSFHLFAMADRHYDRSESPILEDGHTTPADLTPGLHDKILHEFRRAIRAIGIDYGPVKGDIIVDEGGTIWILEVAARTSGGRFISGTIPLAYGYEPLESIIKLAVGESFRFEPPSENVSVASQRYFWADRNGVVASVSRPAAAWSDPSEIQLPVVGAKVSIAESHADRLGWVIWSDPDRDFARRRAIEIRDSVEIRIS
jgi:biotin carboxylase